MALGLAPTKTQRKGQPSSVPELGPIPINGWFLEYDQDSESRRPSMPRLMDFMSTSAQNAVNSIQTRASGWEINFFTFESGGFDAEAQAIRTVLRIRFPF